MKIFVRVLFLVPSAAKSADTQVNSAFLRKKTQA